jgi:predicted nucleic acid-binding protein
MTEFVFVDANIPMYAHGAKHPYRTPCQAALKRILDDNIPAIISSEILQEIIHRYLSLQRPQQALQVAYDVMTLIPTVLSVTVDDIHRVLQLVPRYPDLMTRDLIHVAVMLENGITNILSTDAHFDQVKEVHRIDPRDFADIKSET